MNRVLGCRSNKSSDPFVVLTLEDEMRTDTPDQRKTEVRPNTLNPQFDQTFAFKMRPESHDIRLRVDVFDHDKIGSNDKIGCVSFSSHGIPSRLFLIPSYSSLSLAWADGVGCGRETLLDLPTMVFQDGWVSSSPHFHTVAFLPMY